MDHRHIVHIDMDQFFAAVEQREHPELRGKPVAVAHDGPRSVVSTASYEARPYGVHSALPLQTARRLCPQLIVVEPHFQLYKEVSGQIHGIFHDYTDLVEPLSLDEAFLDVTHNKRGIALATDVAREIKQRIWQETQLTASAGVSYCKFLAKIASDYRKPNGLFVIHPDRAQAFIDQLDVTRIWGVGHKTAERMHRMGIFTGSDLRKVSLPHLVETFGKMGHVFYQFARGIDPRPVVAEWERKSVGCERTFETDLMRPAQMTIELYHTVLELEQRIAKSQFHGRTLTLKVKYNNFVQMTRSLTHRHDLQTKEQLLPLAKTLMRMVSYGPKHPIRLLGLTVSNHQSTEQRPTPQWREQQLPFEPWEDEEIGGTGSRY